MKGPWISKQSGWVKGVIFGCAICTFIALIYFIDIRPLFQHIEQYKGEIAALTTKNDASRKEILRFKKPTPEEVSSWGTLSAYLRERIPEEKETLLAARLLAEEAVRNSLMDVSIKVPTHSASSPTLSQIAGGQPSKTKKGIFEQLKIHSFAMEITYVSSLQASLAFLDEVITNPDRFLQLEKVEIMKDFPFIRTKVLVRFYYGGRLNVKE